MLLRRMRRPARALRFAVAGGRTRAVSGESDKVTPQEHRALNALECASMRLASSGKRFRKDMSRERERNPDFKMTARQALYLWFLVDMYRRQIKDDDLKGWGAHRRLTGELPPIYLEGDHREPVVRVKKAKRTKRDSVATIEARDAERLLF